MTAAEMKRGSERLAELERAQRLNHEALAELRRWWNRAVRMEKNKVVSLDDYREWKECLTCLK